MIRLGLRMAVRGGREAAVRLAVTLIAVALGVGMLLIALAGFNAVNAQNVRTAWLDTVPLPGGQPIPRSAGGAPGTDPLWWRLSIDHVGTQTIDRVDVAATGPGSPVTPGIPRLPGPGEYYASPALESLLHSLPAAELGARFPGRDVGTIGAVALPSPESLIIVVGHQPAQLAAVTGAVQVGSINTDPNLGGAAGGFHTSAIDTILTIGAVALLVPVLVFIATAARLSAARREERFAAMRLVGATPRQVDLVATVESLVAAIGGVIVGFGIFFAIRPAVATIPFTGIPFAPGDLTPGVAQVLIVVIGVPVAAAASAWVAMRRVRISPLGVSRRTTPAALRIYRLAPLLGGVILLVVLQITGRPATDGGQLLAYGSAAVLLLVGLVLAGPLVTAAASRLVTRHARRPAGLLAGRRIDDNPRAAFRAVGGLIVALFAATVSIAVITTVTANGGAIGTDPAAKQILVDVPGLVSAQHAGAAPGQRVIHPETVDVDVPPGLVGRLQAIPGVRGVAVIYQAQVPGGSVSLALCSQLARTPALGGCSAGAQVGQLPDLTLDALASESALGQLHWAAADRSAADLAAGPGVSVRAVVVQSDGSTAAVEEARTALALAFPDQQQPAYTLAEVNAQSARLLIEIREIASTVIVVSLIIGGCSLAVAVVAGVSDRKRPFGLLRLTGVPLRVLRSMVLLEAAVPLVVGAVLSVGLGFLAGGLFLSSQLEESLQGPGVAFFAVVVAGLLAALAVIAATLPLVERISGPEAVRNE